VKKALTGGKGLAPTGAKQLACFDSTELLTGCGGGERPAQSRGTLARPGRNFSGEFKDDFAEGQLRLDFEGGEP
jgi:hypothetical protein